MQGLQTSRVRRAIAITRPPILPFPWRNNGGTRWITVSQSMAGLYAPLPTLRLRSSRTP